MSADRNTTALLQKWADGKATLKDVRGYSDEELYALAKLAYFFYYQGRLGEARVLFQGLYAVDPVNAYFAKALGVVEFAAGNAQGAVSAYEVAIKLEPDDPSAYVGRAEVRISQGQRTQAVEDLRRALELTQDGDPMNVKVSSMLDGLGRR